jgi:hypothetical protein
MEKIKEAIGVQYWWSVDMGTKEEVKPNFRTPPR